MSKLYFRYGSMGSGKSLDLLKVKHNYEENGKNILLLTSSLDNRDGVGKVSSRIGISEPAIAVSKDDRIDHILIGEEDRRFIEFDCILVDEAQFLTKKQVEQLALIVDVRNIPVICYGLKNDFQNNLFEGSEALLTYADKIEEIKTLCTYCKKKATMNLRLHDDKPVYHGEQVQIGGNESYSPVCREHYYNPMTYDNEKVFEALPVYTNTKINGEDRIESGNKATEWTPSPLDDLELIARANRKFVEEMNKPKSVLVKEEVE